MAKSYLIPARAGLALVLLTLPACSTLETGADRVREFAGRHPVITAVGAAVVVGGTVAALQHHSSTDPRRTIQPTPCATNPQVCR